MKWAAAIAVGNRSGLERFRRMWSFTRTIMAAAVSGDWGL